MSVSWHSFDLKTGRRGPRLTTQRQGTVKRILCEPTDTTVEVSCWDDDTQQARPGWDEGTLPGRVMLVALDDDTEQPLWGGMVLRRVSGPSEWVSCMVITLEHYLERRYVGDLEWDDADLATIAAGAIGFQDGDGLDLVVDAPDTGTRLGGKYADSEDKTIASVLEQLVGLDQGIDWTIDLAWADADRTVLSRILRIRSHIGSQQALTTQWTMPGCVTSFTFSEDYTPEHGANDVMAVSSGEGDLRPASDHHVAADLIAGGWARFERRFSPATSLTSTETLGASAAGELARTRDGLSELSIVARMDAAPRLDVDWWLGDDITVSLTCPRFPEQTGPDGDRIPGFTRRLRVTGWEADFDASTLTPITRDLEDS